MSNLKKEYKKIIEEIKDNIKDEKQLEFVNKKINEVSVLFLDMIENLTEIIEERMDVMEDKVERISGILKGIENDIYEDEDMDLGILCPYCNNEFTINIENDLEEIKCPECKNIIELNWNCDDEDCNCGDNCGCGCNDECDCDDDCDCGCNDECDCDDDCDCGCNEGKHCDCNHENEDKE